jgi:hypothetical protein
VRSAPVKKTVQAPATPPAPYKVEVIRGNKTDETKFPDQPGAH